MGKKSFKPNPDTSTAETSNTAGVLFSAFDRTAAAEHFAIVTHSVDRHRLRIFSTRSGTVSNDYSAENKERFTCLSWGAVIDNGGLGQVIATLFSLCIFITHCLSSHMMERLARSEGHMIR